MERNVQRSTIAYVGLVTVLLISANCGGGGGGGPAAPTSGLTPSEQQTAQDGVNSAATDAAGQSVRSEVPKTVRAPRSVSTQVTCRAGGSASATGNIDKTQTSISGNLNLSFNNCGVGNSLVVAGGPVAVGISGSCPPAITVRASGSVRVSG